MEHWISSVWCWSDLGPPNNGDILVQVTRPGGYLLQVRVVVKVEESREDPGVFHDTGLGLAGSQEERERQEQEHPVHCQWRCPLLSEIVFVHRSRSVRDKL